MEFTLDCACGRSVVVRSSEAGTNVACGCGANVAVPSLSRLRAMSGIGSYESGPIDAIRRMLAEGTLPPGETCAVSGRPTRDVMLLHIQCERVHAAYDNTKLMLLAFLVTPLALFALRNDQREAVGRDTSIVVPLRVSCEYHRRLARWAGQRKLRRLLGTVPVYGRLLDEYPNATIRISRDHGAGNVAKSETDPEI
jgi:hypothetical protein